VARAQLSDLSRGAIAPKDIAGDLTFPVIARPRGSHAGAGLAKIDDRAAIERYLAEREEAEFFISRFVDYASDDNLFRKYRIVVVDGRPYAVHMAIAERWDIWYINAGMTQSASKRTEEEAFMRTFDVGFARRHEAALAGMINRVGLDYFTMDCAETKGGSLLIFEADNTAIVHDMDPADIFPYKTPQMRKIFDAFAAMLERRAQHKREQAA
jgi:glutathione synthase/RimK-type ligase-like ATP-grasp enzyme